MVPYGGGQSLLLVRDVTRQMRLEAMRKDFVANASHELRTPLTVISGYLDTLADDPSVDPAWDGPIKDMRAQAQRMNAIIADLLGAVAPGVRGRRGGARADRRAATCWNGCIATR